MEIGLLLVTIALLVVNLFLELRVLEERKARIHAEDNELDTTKYQLALYRKLHNQIATLFRWNNVLSRSIEVMLANYPTEIKAEAMSDFEIFDVRKNGVKKHDVRRSSSTD